VKHAPGFIELSQGFFAAESFAPMLRQMQLVSLEAVFAFDGGDTLAKANIGSWRYRGRIKLPDGRFAYLKRYTSPPAGVQIKGWLQHGRRALLSDYDRGPEALERAGLATPETLAFGGQWRGLFEKRSFILSLEIPDGVSLEKRLPACFETAHGQASSFAEAMEDKEFDRAAHTATQSPDAGSMHSNTSQAPAVRQVIPPPPFGVLPLDRGRVFRGPQRALRKAFIVKVADFVRRFHATGYRHRDLYLAHIFLSRGADLYLIDLHRCFRPRLLGCRYAVKDLAQLHYSCPAEKISNADRLRFFLEYLGQDTLTPADKNMIRRIHCKAVRMARHDRRHGRAAPFERAERKDMTKC